MKARGIRQGALLGKVGLVLEQKVNLGNYESAGVHVSLELPFDAGKEGDAEGAYQDALAFCGAKVTELIEKIKNRSK